MTEPRYETAYELGQRIGHTDSVICADCGVFVMDVAAHTRLHIERQVSADLVRAILEAVCERDGITLESSAEPGEPARNYELAIRLKIGKVFGLREAS
jgi:hypothetical protein